MKSGLTMIRTAHDTYRIITGGADGNRDKKWFSDHLPGDGTVQLADLSSAVAPICEQYPVTVGVVGSAPLFDPKNEKMR